MCTSLLKRCRFRRLQRGQIGPSARRWVGEFRRSRRWRRLRARSVQRGSKAQSPEARDRACREWPETCAASLLSWLRLRSLGGFLAIDIFVADVALGVRANRHAVQNDRAHADQAARLDSATM